MKTALIATVTTAAADQATEPAGRRYAVRVYRANAGDDTTYAIPENMVVDMARDTTRDRTARWTALLGQRGYRTNGWRYDGATYTAVVTRIPAAL